MEADAGMTCAWAVRPQTTSTGAWSCTGGTGTSDYNSFLVSINEQFTVTVTESITLTEAHKQNISLNVNESTTLSEVWDTEQQKWVNQTKNTGTWTNQDKS